jgi:prepilin-type N-terminal cleavage/methylation domain-containing protein
MNSSRSRFGAAKHGFTLVEMLMAVSVSVLTVSVMVSAFMWMRVAYRNLEFSSRRNQNLCAAVVMLQRDLRMAGYGVGVTGTNLHSWFPGAGTITGVVTITHANESNVSDSATIVGALGSATSWLQNSTSAGDITLTVAPGDGGMFNTSTKNVILVGGLEMARVVSISGDRLTISTSATSNGAGLVYAYPYRSTIDLMEATTYSCGLISNSTSQIYYLLRNDHSEATPASYYYAIAANIDLFKITGAGNVFSIKLQGRNELPDPRYMDPVYGDRYRRSLLQMSVTARN